MIKKWVAELNNPIIRFIYYVLFPETIVIVPRSLLIFVSKSNPVKYHLVLPAGMLKIPIDEEILDYIGLSLQKFVEDPSIKTVFRLDNFKFSLEKPKENDSLILIKVRSFLSLSIIQSDLDRIESAVQRLPWRAKADSQIIPRADKA